MSSYSCSFAECVSKKKVQNDGREVFIPLRLLVCGHSICELCVLEFCHQKKEFIKCMVCSFNTTLSEVIHKNVIQCESEIKKWLDTTSSAAQIMKLDTNLFPLDLQQIGIGVELGLLSATKTAEMVDLDLDDEPAVSLKANVCQSMNSLFEDDKNIRQIVDRIPKTCKKSFQESVEFGVKTFCNLSSNHTSVKRLCDETKDYMKKSKSDVMEVFHKFHSVLQMRQKEVLKQMDKLEDNRQKELKVIGNEILSKRSELKGKLLQCLQTQTDKDRSVLRQSIDKLVKDSNVLPMNSPQNQFKFTFDETIEPKLKSLGSVDTISPAIAETTDVSQEDIPIETAIDISSDEEEEQNLKTDDTLNKEVVNVLQVISPNKFYVQKSSDKERFETLNNNIQTICLSIYNHSPPIDTLREGEYVFAYSSLKKCWCRATITLFRSESNPQSRDIYMADIVLIDYGISETVEWFNVREKKSELFDVRKWPPFAYKCSLNSLKPKRSVWSDGAINLFKRYVNKYQLILFDFGTIDGYKFVDLIHYDIQEVTYQIPSVIEVLVKNDMAVLSADIDFSGYCRQKTQPIVYKDPDLPQTLRTVSVLVSHVETPDLFYVQLQRQHQNLMKLWEDLNETYTEENTGIYTYYLPRLNTPCAAIFDGDGKYYRALVIKKGNNFSEFVVRFVDFGNEQTVKVFNMRLLKDSFMTLPIQAIPCGLIHVEPAFRFKWSDEALKYFKILISDEKGPQILTMCVYEERFLSTNVKKLMVVLRSYDGDNGIKLNEKMVREKHAYSSGPHSKSDFDDRSALTGSHESLNTLNSSPRSVKSTVTLPYKVSVLHVLQELLDRFKSSYSTLRDSLIRVKVTSIVNPSKFYVQIDRQELNDCFKSLETELLEEYDKPKHQFLGNVNFSDGDLLAYKMNGIWRRGRVTGMVTLTPSAADDSAPKEPQFQVFDIDFGEEHTIKVSQMRHLTDTFKKDSGFALECTLYCLRPTGGHNWTNLAKDDFKEFVDKDDKELYILVKETAEKEPISVLLYNKKTVISSAFAPQKILYSSINTIFIVKGLAIREKTVGDYSESVDDNEINTVSDDRRSQMPFTLQLNNKDSLLDNLQKSFGTEPTNQNSSGVFEYQPEVYPTQQSFYGYPTDLILNEFKICFRLFYDNMETQPLRLIENAIEETLKTKKELMPFDGAMVKGNACTAFFDYDNTWNRAEILGVTQDKSRTSKLVARFVDYGQQESFLVDKLSSEVFGRNTPKLALLCHLVNIKPLNDEADKEIQNIIYQKLFDRKCRFFWENYPRLPMRATIEFPESEEYISLLSYLKSKNLLSSDEMEDNDCLDTDLEIQTLITRTYGLYPIVFDINRFYEVMVSFPLANDYLYCQIMEMSDQSKEQVIINSEHNLFMKMMNSVRAEVHNYRRFYNCKAELACVAQDKDDCWYRGLIVNVNPSDETAEIFFVDYGNSDWFAFDRLRVIPNHIMKPRAHALLCQLFNIRPANKLLWTRNKELVQQLTSHLTEICSEDNNRKLLAKFKSNKYPLKIDLYLSDWDNPTQPDRHVFQDFVDKGLVEFIEERDVYHKPIRAVQSYRNEQTVNRRIKTEPIH